MNFVIGIIGAILGSVITAAVSYSIFQYQAMQVNAEYALRAYAEIAAVRPSSELEPETVIPLEVTAKELGIRLGEEAGDAASRLVDSLDCYARLGQGRNYGDCFSVLGRDVSASEHKYQIRTEARKIHRENYNKSFARLKDEVINHVGSVVGR